MGITIKNPFEFAIVAKTKYTKRDIWTSNKSKTPSPCRFSVFGTPVVAKYEPLCI